MAQLRPQPAAPTKAESEVKRRAEEERARKREEREKLDLRTAIPRERYSGVSYSWVSPTASSFGAEAHDIPRPATRPARDPEPVPPSRRYSEDRYGNSRPEQRRRSRPPPQSPRPQVSRTDSSSNRGKSERRTASRPPSDTNSSRQRADYKEKRDRPPRPQRRGTDQSRERGPARAADDKVRRREGEREGDRRRKRSPSRDRRRPSESSRGGLLEELLKMGPWRA